MPGLARTDPFPRALERVTFLLVLLGFLAIAVSGEVGPLVFGFGLGLMLLSRLRDHLPWVPTDRQWNWATGFVLGFCICYWRLVTHDPLPAILIFTTFLQVLRLFSSRSARDVLQVFVIAFAMLLLASVLTTSPLFLPLCLGFGVCLLLGLVLLTIRREAERSGALPTATRAATAPVSAAPSLNALVTRRFVSGIAGASLLLYLLAAVFFVSLPRYQGQDWFSGLRSNSRGSESGGETTSGFEGSVGLGDITEIRLDPTIVMRVRFAGEAGESDVPLVDHLRMRGQGLDVFTGEVWEVGGRRRPPGVMLYRGSEFRDFNGDSDGVGQEEDLVLDIEQEADVSRHVFGQSQPVALRLLQGRPLAVFPSWRSGSAWFGEGLRGGFLRYEVGSDTDSERPIPLVDSNPAYRPLEYLPGDTPAALAARVSEDFYAVGDRRFVPFTGTEPWTRHAEPLRAIAAQWAREGRCRDPVEIAQEIVRRLNADCAYTLSPRVTTPDFPILGFLTETHEGHCEYFASAMVLLLRTLNIPARLATGYLTGEWNAAGRFFVVRESHAHAWVEMSGLGQGWLTFDPTPPAGLPPSLPLTSWRRFLHWLDAHRHQWYRWVIDLDQAEQSAIYRSLGLPVQAWQHDLRVGLWRLVRWGRHTAPGSAAAISGIWAIVIVAGLVGIAVIVRRSLPRRRPSRPRAAANPTPYYRRLVSWLRHQGHTRRPGMTPEEFARRVVGVRPDWGAVAHVTRLYYRDRYAPSPLSPAERAEAEAMVEGLVRG